MCRYFTLQPVRQHRHFMSRQQSELSRQTVLELRWDLACYKDPSQIHRYNKVRTFRDENLYWSRNGIGRLASVVSRILRLSLFNGQNGASHSFCTSAGLHRNRGIRGQVIIHHPFKVIPKDVPAKHIFFQLGNKKGRISVLQRAAASDFATAAQVPDAHLVNCNSSGWKIACK